MNTWMTALFLLLCMFCVFQHWTLHRIRKLGKARPLKAGEVVLYNSPHDPKGRNMITVVLAVFDNHKTAVIRHRGTTATVHQDWLQVLRIDPAHPLHVPEPPYVEAATIENGRAQKRQAVSIGDRLPEKTVIVSAGNRAGFSAIPWSYTGYGMCLDDRGCLSVKRPEGALWPYNHEPVE